MKLTFEIGHSVLDIGYSYPCSMLYALWAVRFALTPEPRTLNPAPYLFNLSHLTKHHESTHPRR